MGHWGRGRLTEIGFSAWDHLQQKQVYLNLYIYSLQPNSGLDSNLLAMAFNLW